MLIPLTDQEMNSLGLPGMQTKIDPSLRGCGKAWKDLTLSYQICIRFTVYVLPAGDGFDVELSADTQSVSHLDGKSGFLRCTFRSYRDACAFAGVAMNGYLSWHALEDLCGEH